MTRDKVLWIYICILLVIVCAPVIDGCGRGSVYIKDNGYRRILVAISEDIPEDASLLQRIRNVFTEASGILYTASRTRAYFHDVTILVPITWSDQPHYEAAGREAFDKSDVVIDAPDIRFGGTDKPFTIRTTPCGEFGHYVHLTLDYLMNATVGLQYGSYGKVLVHEWAHLRFGLFNEHPEEGDLHFYASSSGEIKATRCSASITGSRYDVSTGRIRCRYRGNLPDGNCRFREDITSGRYASIMYKPEMENIVSFCDNDPADGRTLHNSESPSKQNRLCGGKSAWEIIREHPDFTNGQNRPQDVSDTTPIFHVVTPRMRRTVLVLDISSSMGLKQSGEKLFKLVKGCSTFITSVVSDGEFMGIVWFNETAFRASELIQIRNTSRQLLLNALPTFSGGSTSIGGGIREGLNLLQSQTNSASGSILVVISDGAENRAPYIWDVSDEILDSNITVHSIAITNKADTSVDALAQLTGGYSFLYSADDTSNALMEAFSAIGELNKNPLERRYTTKSESSRVKSGQSLSGEFILDEPLGRDVEITFDYSGSDIGIKMTSPSGMTYSMTSPECRKDAVFGIYRFVFANTNELGRWHYNITNSHGRTQRIAATVSAKTRRNGEYPIIAQVFWGKRLINDISNTLNPEKQIIFASVSKGYSPVLDAVVVATVERPSGDVIVVKLRDNGASSDTKKDDGIYSSFFIDMNASGRYSVKISVNNIDSTIISTRRIIGQGLYSEYDQREASRTRRNTFDVPVGDFRRTVSGGSFHLASFIGGSSKLYPPGQITDLTVLATDHVTSQVTLQWTSVGDQLDQGQATEYILKYSDNFEEMRRSFSKQQSVTSDMIVSGSLSTPATAGNVETMTLEMSQEGTTFIFAISARDLVGRDVIGPMSNLVSISMRIANDGGLSAGKIVGLTIGILAVIVVLTSILVFVLKYKAKKNGVNQDPEDAAVVKVERIEEMKCKRVIFNAVTERREEMQCKRVIFNPMSEGTAVTVKVKRTHKRKSRRKKRNKNKEHMLQDHRKHTYVV